LISLAKREEESSTGNSEPLRLSRHSAALRLLQYVRDEGAPLRASTTITFATKEVRGVNEVRILLTNDDGVYAPGLRALLPELRRLGEVLVVAPATEQSAVGHSITLANPLIVAGNPR